MTRPSLSGPVYVVRFRAVGPHSIRGLRALLKFALRRHGLRAVSVEQINEPKKGLDHDDPETKPKLAE